MKKIILIVLLTGCIYAEPSDFKFGCVKSSPVFHLLDCSYIAKPNKHVHFQYYRSLEEAEKSGRTICYTCKQRIEGKTSWVA